jgi:hypothetical protein
MTDIRDRRAPLGREQPWSDDPPHSGRIVAVTDNPIGRAIIQVARIVGRPALLLADEDVRQSPLEWLSENPLGDDDALVLCDHDTPQMEALLRQTLAGGAGPTSRTGVLDAGPVLLSGGVDAAACTGWPQHRRQDSWRDRALSGRRDRRSVPRSRRRPDEAALGSQRELGAPGGRRRLTPRSWKIPATRC